MSSQDDARHEDAHAAATPGDEAQPLQSIRGDEDERPDVTRAMAAYSGDGQVDDETGGDAAAGAATEPGESRGEDDREPHGPA